VIGYRGQQVLDYVIAASAANRRPPSYTEIADALGMGSVANVAHVVRRLERRGLLRRADTGSRYRKGWHKPVIVVGK